MNNISAFTDSGAHLQIDPAAFSMPRIVFDADATNLDAACREVAGSVSLRQSATETKEQFVRRIARAVLLEMLK